MAELDPDKVGRSGFDPVTGSPLSQDVRNALLRKSVIDQSVFKNQLQESENRKKEIDTQNNNVIKSQEQTLLGFNSNIQALRNDIGKLGTGLANIALLLRQDADQEVSRTKTEQENQRRLSERQIRIGKENEIEQKIQNALVAPVQKLTPKVSDVFGKIGTALGILFGGWLTSQVVQAIKASEEGNTKLFNDLKFNIVKNLAIVGGGLFAIRTGFSLIKRTIGGIASGLTRLLIAKPLAIAAGLLRNVPGLGPKTTGPKTTGPKTTGPKTTGPNFIGGALSLYTALRNLGNGEITDFAMQGVLGVLSLTPVGRLVGAVRTLLGVAVTADEIAEVFGSNIFGKNPNILRDVKKVKENAEKEKNKNKPEESTKPAPSSAPPEPAPAAQPQTPMMGEQKPSTPPPSPEMVSQFEQAWQYRNNPFARSRIEGAWEKMTPEQKQQAKDWASSKGYNWSEMKLSDPSPAMVSPQSNTQTTETTPSAAQVSAPPKSSTEVGQLPEVKPSLTMIKTSNNSNQQANVPLTSGALSDVPLINSANPDNFYVLYSQLNYNVVT